MLGPYTLGEQFTGGVERHVKSLVLELRKFDLELHLVSVSKTMDKSEVLVDGNLTIHRLKSLKLPMTVTGISLDPINIVRKVNEINPDIVHGQMLGAPYGFATALLSGKYPSILTIHTTIAQLSKTARTLRERIHDLIWNFLENWELKRIPWIIVVSPHLVGELQRMGARNIAVISNGIDPTWFELPNENIDGRILFTGRIVPIKGIENLIRALKIVVERKHNVELHIVGNAQDLGYLERLKKEARELGVDYLITYTGGLYGNDLLREYAECSIFVLPSLYESSPIVLLEAMAVGKPIIATNVGGIPFLVEDGSNGFLVESGNVDHLAEKILNLVQDDRLREKMGNRGREKARNFTWDRIAAQTFNIYKEIYENS
jgi:glycosyltransferase involved in cell wall biosynthesis